MLMADLKSLNLFSSKSESKVRTKYTLGLCEQRIRWVELGIAVANYFNNYFCDI